MDLQRPGTLDAGITGRDWTQENQSDVVIVTEMVYSKVSFRPTRWVLAVPHDSPVQKLDDLAGKRVGAQTGSVYATYLKENLVDKGLSKATDIFLYQDANSAVRDLKENKIDYFMLDRLPARNFAQAEGLKVVGEGFNPQNFAIAMRTGSDLTGALNDALLKAQNDGTVAALIQEFLKLSPNQRERQPAHFGPGFQHDLP